MADLRQGIIETAATLGIDPVDLATIISYETGGTFDPSQPGPTTQWGQHRGLIQFGEPQAQEYGVNWADPLGSQLGPNGAIVRYFQGNGWQPGMGLLDAYSIVNAGGPGRYGASDANNGGAPGTVADKVNEQMGGHRENALRLLGISAGPAGGPVPPSQSLPPSNALMAAQRPPMNALAQQLPAPPQWQNALNVQDFLRPTNALAQYGFQPGMSPYLGA